MASEDATPSGPAKRILSLDGGGVKGISTLMILQAILNEVALIEDGPKTVTQQNKPGTIVTAETCSQTERKPIDYFDLQVGTSTGGIIAVQLGRLGLTCSDAICLYDEFAQNVFAIRALGINFSKSKLLGFLGPLVLKIKLLFGSQFSATYVDDSIDKLLTKHGLCDNTKLVSDQYNPPNARGRIIMCATMVNAGKAILFRNYKPPCDAIPETEHGDNNRLTAPPAPPYLHASPLNDIHSPEALLRTFDYNCVEIRQAIRATSAAPTYLPPEHFQDVTFWDGGLLNNNPIDQAWSARFDLSENDTEEPYISSIVSLGTGKNSPSKPKTGLISRLLGILNETIGFASNVEAKHWDFRRDVYRRNLRLPKELWTDYFRFDVPLGNTFIDLADYKMMGKLADITQCWLKQEDVKCEIHACALTLAKRKWSDTQA